MKYPDIDIQIKYPNKLINADTPSVSMVPVLVSFMSTSVNPILIRLTLHVQVGIT